MAEAIDAWQPHVKQDAAVGSPPQGLKAFFSAGDRFSGKTLVAQHRSQRLANAAFVVDNEN